MKINQTKYYFVIYINKSDVYKYTKFKRKISYRLFTEHSSPGGDRTKIVTNIITFEM